MEANAFSVNGDYFYFDNWRNDQYDLFNSDYDLTSLGCLKFSFSEVSNCSKLFISIDS